MVRRAGVADLDGDGDVDEDDDGLNTDDTFAVAIPFKWLAAAWLKLCNWLGI